LLPPSLDEWLPEDHFARFVIAAVEAMDLSAFYADYQRRRTRPGGARSGDDGRVLVYAYARGQRSSRVIERGCFQDIAFRSANGTASNGNARAMWRPLAA
jgi:transposase